MCFMRSQCVTPEICAASFEAYTHILRAPFAIRTAPRTSALHQKLPLSERALELQLVGDGAPGTADIERRHLGQAPGLDCAHPERVETPVDRARSIRITHDDTRPSHELPSLRLPVQCVEHGQPHRGG